MLRPSIFEDNLFEDLFDFSDFDKLEQRMNKKLYGHHAKNLMKTDIKENDSDYEMLIDLPGFKKDEIKVQLDNGYLTISAARGLDSDEKNEETGNYIRRERYAGSCERSFYVGDCISQNDVKAEFKHGILKLQIPKLKPAVEQKHDNYIAIEG